MNELRILLKQLPTRWCGKGANRLEDQMDSTNRAAKEMARAGAPHGSLAVCSFQTAGRGRMDRRWETPAGEALTQTLVLRPKLPPQEAALCTFAAALAAAKAIEEVCPELKPGLKWPNDVVIDGKKCVGILLEMVMDENGYAVVPGVGVNVNQTAFSPQLADRATSLRLESGRELDRWQILCAYLKHMEQAVDALEAKGFEGIWPEYASRSVTLDKPVRVVETGYEFVGRAKAVDESGALIVTDETGSDRRVLSGDVSVRGMWGYVD